MYYKNTDLKPGMEVVSPGTRHLLVKEIIVPRNYQSSKSRIPRQFRNLGRKIVIFENNTVATLAEVKRHYRIIDKRSH